MSGLVRSFEKIEEETRQCQPPTEIRTDDVLEDDIPSNGENGD